MKNWRQRWYQTRFQWNIEERKEGGNKPKEVISSNYEFKKRKKRILFSTCKARKLRSLYSRNCTYMQLANGKRKKRRKKERKLSRCLRNTVPTVISTNKEERLPWFCIDLLYKVLLSCWYDDKSTLFEEKPRIRNIEKWIEPFQHLGSCCWFLLYPFMSFQSLRVNNNVERSDFS